MTGLWRSKDEDSSLESSGSVEYQQQCLNAVNRWSRVASLDQSGSLDETLDVPLAWNNENEIPMGETQNEANEIMGDSRDSEP